MAMKSEKTGRYQHAQLDTPGGTWQWRYEPYGGLAGTSAGLEAATVMARSASLDDGQIHLVIQHSDTVLVIAAYMAGNPVEWDEIKRQVTNAEKRAFLEYLRKRSEMQGALYMDGLG